MVNDWNPGDWAVYRKSKVSTSPGPRATNVHAAPKGDNYTYIVDKFWIVDRLLPDGEVQLHTARGKTRIVRQDDPCLRRPTLVQRLVWRNRFRQAEEALESQPHSVAGNENGATATPSAADQAGKATESVSPSGSDAV